MTNSSTPTDQTPNQSAAPASGAPANAAAPVVNASPAPDQKPAEGKPAAAPATKVAATADGAPAAAAESIAADGQTAGQPAGEVPPKGEPAAAPDAAQAAALPETYALPPIEGVEYNPQVLTVMTPAFKDAKLTQSQVDTVVKTFMEYQQGLPKALMAADLEVTMKDKELGGMNWGRTQGYISDALGAFTTPAFRSQLDKWGIANNPEFVRTFARIGRAMRGDDIPGSQPTSAPEESRADRMYGRKK
jgi:hypothetical protein